ncbi:hypothetical protein QA612_01335 [Evansella sp. AB-P1]|uniref:hypothetical protein n=1 Tax=Evansella sp. AB-P1 TaxID=3037653 RepID=UPI00241DB78B|nr:hypothetical protein [Evansella sp. AB-P1]MDG5786115.1 hypothetical protein [Evansella sp. AB-P1]
MNHLTYSDPFQTSLDEILSIVKYESTDELLFDYLKVLVSLETHEEILDKMIKDERIHYETLKQIYYQLTQKLPEVDAPVFNIPESYVDGLTEILLRKSNVLQHYVVLLQYLPPMLAPIIYPMIIKEQTHMQLLNYLIVDYKCA